MRTLDICRVTLYSGKHDEPEDHAEPKGCGMEILAWWRGEGWTDHPACVCPVLASGFRRINDARWPTDADRTRVLLPLLVACGPEGVVAEGPLVGTRSTPQVERKRAYFLADKAVRYFAPLWLDAAGRKDDAARLRALDPIVDAASAETARAASRAAYAAYADAAYAAAYAADAASASAASAAASASAADAADAAYAAYAASAADAAAYAAYAARRIEVYSAFAAALVEAAKITEAVKP